MMLTCYARLVSSPAAEATEIVDKLAGTQDNSLRLTLFSLQKFIKEELFVQEFLKLGGLAELLAIIETSHGNTLAVCRLFLLRLPSTTDCFIYQYALTAMRNLMDCDYGWGTLDGAFIFRVCPAISYTHAPIV